MGKEKNLLGYIEYFKNKENKFYELKTPIDGSKIVRYFDYDIKFLNFLDEFVKTDMVDYSYVANMEKINVDEINGANKRELGTILTYYLRNERFVDGTWAEAIDKDIFLNCLIELEKLVE